MDNLVDYDFLESYLKDFELKRPDLEDVADLLAVIRSLLEGLPAEERKEILRMQGYLIDRLSDYQPEPIRPTFDPSKRTWQFIRELLDRGKKRGGETFIALQLVGAVLNRSFMTIDLRSNPYAPAEVQLNQYGDFLVGDTVFHVTVAPTLALYEKCKTNLEQGLKVYLLVPDSLIAWTKENAEVQAAGKISVESIESFVSQNIDELSKFSRSEIAKQILKLLQIYNKRVDAAEANKSMMIDIPVNLQKLAK